MRRLSVLPLLPLLVGLAVPVQAQEVPIVVATALPNTTVPNAAVSLLVRQGQRWLDQGRPELAMSSVERALSSEPSNADALILAARIAMSRGNSTAANAYAAQLHAAGASPNEQAAMEAELRVVAVDRLAIEDARRLAREGRSDDAAAKYRAIFSLGNPPPAYAREYYQALAATEAGRDAGQGGLARLAAAPNADDRTLLANAEALTFAPATRADGLRRLAELAGRSAAIPEVQRAWKQALGFYGDDPASLPQFEAFLRRFPNDIEIKNRLEVLRAMPAATHAGPGDEMRRRGFTELEAGALRPSAERFEAALAVNSGDADALGGLGIVRLRENRTAEARTLLERAVAADPARGAQWRRALDGASYTLELTEARTLMRRGDTAGSEVILRRATKRDVEDATDAESLLGEVTLHRGDPAEAERHFRLALARRPGFAPAGTGLNQALRAQGRPAEIPEPRPRPTDAGAPLNTEATRLRTEASHAANPTTETALLQNAVALAPSDPWIRLDLARSLRRQGRDAEARALVEELAAGSPSADSAYAAALLAQESGRPADAEAFLARIPPQRRTVDMARLSVRVRTQAEVARAAALLPTAPADARQRLLALASRPDPSGGTAAEVIRALGDAGDQTGAVNAARVAEVTNRTTSARLAIAGALLAAGEEAEGAALASQIDEASLTLVQRRDISALRTGAAVRASDRLNEAGDQAAAFERLRPALASGTSPDAELALARLYQGARQPGEAMRISNAVLARDPRNLDARRGAAEAAIVAGDRHQAEVLAAEGRVMAPTDSRATLLSAQVARAFGNNIRAQTLLETAAAQRREELGEMTPPAKISVRGSANPFQTVDTSVAVVGMTAVPGDRVSREIAQELTLVRNDAAPRALGSASVRVRSGTAGLDQLQELSTTAQASFQPGKLGGRITTRVTPVFLDAGKLPTTGDPSLRFGSNAVRGLTTADSNTAAGAALNVAYQRGDLVRVDVGTSPLGFPVTNLLGGIEIAPKLTDAVHLRVRAERRSVVDSLLSYAGVKDGSNGQTWGGVTQTGGRVQLEAKLGAGTAYAAGGYAIYEGQHVAHNAKIEIGSGFSYPVYKDRDGEVTTGLDLVYFAFDNNQRGFTLGQGGYFSPRNFVAFNIPVDYRGKLGDLRYRLGATAGYASFREDASPLFPSDPALQARVEAAAQVDPLVPTHNQAQTRNGLIGGVRVDLDYPLSDALTLGGGLRYDKAANWNETQVNIRLENRF